MLKGKITKIENEQITILLENGSSYSFDKKIFETPNPTLNQEVILLASLSKAENVAQSELAKIILNLLLDNQD